MRVSIEWGARAGIPGNAAYGRKARAYDSPNPNPNSNSESPASSGAHDGAERTSGTHSLTHTEDSLKVGKLRRSLGQANDCRSTDQIKKRPSRSMKHTLSFSILQQIAR